MVLAAGAYGSPTFDSTAWTRGSWRSGSKIGYHSSCGVVLLPCELIDQNGPALKAAVLHFARRWELDPAFARWLDEACTFCSTLVDRIVTGMPADAPSIEAALGYRDQFLVAAEYYYLFVIEGPAWVGEELKLAGAGLNKWGSADGVTTREFITAEDLISFPIAAGAMTAIHYSLPLGATATITELTREP